MRGSTFVPILMSLLVATVFAGCDDQNLFDKAPGAYKGFVAQKAGASPHGTQVLVKTDIKAVSKTVLGIEVAALTGGGKWHFDVKAEKNGSIELGNLKLGKRGNGCFGEGKDKDHPEAELCFDGRELSIDLVTPATGDIYTLVIDKIDPSREPKPETAGPYTLMGLLDRTMDHSFTTQVEFQHVVQARLNAQLSAEMLLPHLSMGTILGVVLGGWTSLFHAVGDLAPFLFPGRWIQAKEASLQAKAEADTMILTKADAANIVEGLAYTIERDRKIIEKMQENIASISSIRDEIVGWEHSHLITVGSSDDVNSILNSLDKGVSGLRQMINEERTGLAQAAGFYNPEAITDVTIDREFDIEQPMALDQANILSVTLQRSYELDQIDVLIDSARWNKWERAFTWFDIGGAAAGNIGVNLYPYITFSSSQLQELAVKRQETEAILNEKVVNLFGELNQSLEAYSLSKQGVAIQQRRLTRIMSMLRMGLSTSLADLISALQDSVKCDIDQINAEYAYYVGASKINRLLFAGPYARLSPELQQPVERRLANATRN